MTDSHRELAEQLLARDEQGYPNLMQATMLRALTHAVLALVDTKAEAAGNQTHAPKARAQAAPA